MDDYLKKLETKLDGIIAHFKRHFKNHEIQCDDAGSKNAKKAVIRAIKLLLSGDKKDKVLNQHHSLSSPIYSYDIADNDYYQGIMTME